MKTRQILLIIALCIFCTAIQAQSISVPELLNYLEKRSPAIERKLRHKGFSVRTYKTQEGYNVLFGEKSFNSRTQGEQLLEEKKNSERYTFEYEVKGNRGLLNDYKRQIETEGFAFAGSRKTRYSTTYYKKINKTGHQPQLIEIAVLDYGSQFVLYFKRSDVRLKAVRGDEFFRRRLCHCRDPRPAMSELLAKVIFWKKKAK